MADSKEKTTKPQEPRRQSEDSPERALTIEIDKNFENSKDEVTKKLEEDVKKPALKEQFAKVYERTRVRSTSYINYQILHISGTRKEWWHTA